MKLRSLVLGIALLVPSVSYADIVLPGEHTVEACLSVENMSQFPGYDFVVTGDGLAYPFASGLTSQEKCLPKGGYRELLAIQKNSAAQMKHYSGEEDEFDSNWPYHPANAQLVVTPGFKISLDAGQTPDSDPVQEIHETIHVDSVTPGTGVTAHVASLITKDIDGTMKTLLSTKTINTVMPTTPTSTPRSTPVLTTLPNVTLLPTVTAMTSPITQVTIYQDNTNYYLIAVVAVVGLLGLVLAYKSWKK